MDAHFKTLRRILRYLKNARIFWCSCEVRNQIQRENWLYEPEQFLLPNERPHPEFAPIRLIHVLTQN